MRYYRTVMLRVMAVSYVYDGFGDAIQQTSPDSGTTVYHYNAYGDLTQKVDALSVTTNYTYDKLDRILNRTYPADSTQNVYYTYDKTGGLFGFGIGRLGTLTDTVGNIGYQYDERGNIVAQRRYNSGGTELNALFPAYNAASRLEGYTYPSGLYVAFELDAAGNVGEVQVLPHGSSTYQTVGWFAYYPFGPQKYLTFGNSIGEGLTHDQDYRTYSVTDVAGSTTFQNLTYTLNGNNNATAITDGVTPANDQTLGYDVINRLTSASGAYGSYSWTYDKVGNRLTQTLGSTTTNYGYTSGTNRLASIGSTTVSTNANGNITSIPPANSSQSAVWGASYDPFGNTGSITTSITQNLRLPGQEFDPTTGFYQNGFRDYAPQIGRYLEPDPTWLGGGLDMYSYAGQNPVVNTDPSGLQAAQAVDVGAAAVACAENPACAAFAQQVAKAVLASLSPAQAEDSDEACHNQNVVRAGLAKAKDLETKTIFSPNGHGFSVQTAPNVSIDELARGGSFPNQYISYTTKLDLMMIPGVIVNSPTPGQGLYHGTVVVPYPPPAGIFESISATFQQKLNPYRVQK